MLLFYSAHSTVIKYISSKTNKQNKTNPNLTVSKGFYKNKCLRLLMGNVFLSNFFFFLRFYGTIKIKLKDVIFHCSCVPVMFVPKVYWVCSYRKKSVL